MIQKLQTFTNFNGMNKFLPKARTALLSTVAAVGLGAMTSCSSCSNDHTNNNKIENVAPEYYQNSLETTKIDSVILHDMNDLSEKVSISQCNNMKNDMLIHKKIEKINKLIMLKKSEIDKTNSKTDKTFRAKVRECLIEYPLISFLSLVTLIATIMVGGMYTSFKDIENENPEDGI